MTLTARAPLRRCGKRYASERAALSSKRGLTGQYGAVPCLCQGWHLVSSASKPAPKPKAPRDTGPSRKVRALVLARDGHACVCCGCSVIGQQYALQHRDSRGMGGTSDPLSSTPVNLITMLRACHERVESRKFEADNLKGYWLKMGQDAAIEPVQYFSPHGSGFTAWLCDSGELIFEAPARSA